MLFNIKTLESKFDLVLAISFDNPGADCVWWVSIGVIWACEGPIERFKSATTLLLNEKIEDSCQCSHKNKS